MTQLTIVYKRGIFITVVWLQKGTSTFLDDIIALEKWVRCGKQLIIIPVGMLHLRTMTDILRQYAGSKRWHYIE